MVLVVEQVDRRHVAVHTVEVIGKHKLRFIRIRFLLIRNEKNKQDIENHYRNISTVIKSID